MNNPRVLLVEDDAFVVVQTRMLLEAAGYEVVGPATRLGEAMALAEAEPIDAAILDIHLAGADVWPAADLLRSRNIGFVICSGLGSELAVPACYRNAPRVDKPFRRDTLLNALTLAMPKSP